MNTFTNTATSSEKETILRLNSREKLLSYGIDFLDDALTGIMPNDLVLIGAGSGSGKTQLCTNIALANVTKGKRVHFFALEADEHEIARRIKFQIIAKHYFNDPPNERPRCEINYTNFLLGDFFKIQGMSQYEGIADHEIRNHFQNLNVFYKGEKFDVDDLIREVAAIQDETDLIIVDHVHYFDYDDDNESRSVKEIAKAARTLALNFGKPIILISHLRKRDKFSKEICPGIEEFHGSSDLYKIATRAITIAPGPTVSNGYETYMRVVKNRLDGGCTRFMAKCVFNARRGNYEKGYSIGSANQNRDDGFHDLERPFRPSWAKLST
jgi:replicative DNA helicase